MAVPSRRDSDKSNKRTSMLPHLHKGHTFFHQDDLLYERVMR